MIIAQETGQRRWAIDTLYTAATDREPGDPLDCAACGARHPRRCIVDFTPGPNDPRHLLAALCRACEGSGTWDDLKRAERRIGERQPRLLRLGDSRDMLLLVVDPDHASGGEAAS